MSTPPAHGREVVSWIDHHAARTPDRVAVEDLGRAREMTYAELSRRVRGVARALSDVHGVGPGDRVAVLSRTDARVLEVLHACATLGAIAVPLNWRLTATELRAVVDDCTPTVFIEETWLADTAGTVAEATSTSHLFWASEPGEPDRYDELTTTVVPASWSPGPVDEDADWAIVYTSGTTGAPKGVRATHRASSPRSRGSSPRSG